MWEKTQSSQILLMATDLSVFVGFEVESLQFLGAVLVHSYFEVCRLVVQLCDVVDF
jgi:hypothetical protein